MNEQLNTDIPTAEILMATGVLREVGFDEEAEKFKASLFDQELLPEALQALEVLVKNPRSEDSRIAKEAAFRAFKRLQRITQPR